MALSGSFTTAGSLLGEGLEEDIHYLGEFSLVSHDLELILTLI